MDRMLVLPVFWGCHHVSVGVSIGVTVVLVLVLVVLRTSGITYRR
jgi:hypothetical protein